MKDFKNLNNEIEKLEAFHKKVIEDQTNGKPTKPLEMPVNEAYDDADDLYTFIITDDPLTTRHIDPLLKTSRKSQIKSWEKVAEFGAKAFAKKAKLPDDWDFLFPKKTRTETAKKLMKHFK